MKKRYVVGAFALFLATAPKHLFGLSQGDLNFLQKNPNVWRNWFLFVTAEGGLNVRKEPRAESESLLLLKKGAYFHFQGAEGPTVTIGGQSSTWLRYETRTVKGYVFGGYIAFAKPPLMVYTPEQVAEFTKVNKAFYAEKQEAERKREADALAAHRVYQNCSGVCGTKIDWERVEFRAACDASLRNLIKQQLRGLPSERYTPALWEAVSKLDNPYCQGLLQHSRETPGMGPGCSYPDSFFSGD